MGQRVDRQNRQFDLIAMQGLSRRERDLVSAKFRLDNRRRLQDVAGLYGISPQRASQIVKAAIDKLHKELAA